MVGAQSVMHASVLQLASPKLQNMEDPMCAISPWEKVAVEHTAAWYDHPFCVSGFVYAICKNSSNLAPDKIALACLSASTSSSRAVCRRSKFFKTKSQLWCNSAL